MSLVELAVASAMKLGCMSIEPLSISLVYRSLSWTGRNVEVSDTSKAWHTPPVCGIRGSKQAVLAVEGVAIQLE